MSRQIDYYWFAAVAVAVAVGAVVGFIAGRYVRPGSFAPTAAAPRRSGEWYRVALFCGAVMVLAALPEKTLSFVEAAVIIVLGAITLVAASRALSLLADGAAVELQTEWGGLGGGLGGWRLSPVVGLIFLALIFGGSAVAFTASAIKRDTGSGGGPQATATATAAKPSLAPPPPPAKPADAGAAQPAP